MSAIIYSANLRLAVVSAIGAVTGGYIGLLNPVKIALNTPAPQIYQQISRQNGSVGQIKSQAFEPKPTDLEINVDDLNDQRVLGWAFNGTTTGVTQTGGSISAEAVTAGALGDWIALANRSVSAVVVEAVGGTPIYTAGTDYVLDATAGMIQPLVGGAITSAEALHVNYTAAALTGTQLAGATVTSSYLRVDADMINLVDQSHWHLVVPVFQASAQGALDLVGKSLLVAGMKGAMLTLNSAPPFTLTQYT